MYKNASENSQNRAVRAALRGSRAELDESVFTGSPKEAEERRAQLIAETKAIEARIGVLNAHIQRASGVRAAGGGFTTARTFGNWKIERAELVQELLKKQAQLAEASKHRRLDKDERHAQFEHVFVTVAREMLAEAVWNRIQIAAAHRMMEHEAAGTAANG